MSKQPTLFEARVAAIRRVGSAGTLIDLDVPSSFPEPRAGQFVQLACHPEGRFRLNRPFGVCSWEKTKNGGTLGILFAVVGEGTEWLDAREPGESIRLLGPLGNRFRPVPGRQPVLVAGGRGVAPLLMLADQLAPDTPDGHFLYGAAFEGALFPTDRSPYLVHFSTLDGSVGHRGTVIDLLKQLIDRGAFRPDQVFLSGCGPLPMLAALAAFAGERGMPVQVSMETRFGCGTGLCAGCAVPLKVRPGDEGDSFERFGFACTDGPVFDGSRIDWPEVRE